MLTGQPPFRGDYEQAVIYSIINSEPEPPLTIKPDLPPELNRIITKVLHKNPNQRYQEFTELRSDLDRLYLIRPTNDATTEKHKPKKLRKTMTGSLAGLMVIIAVTIGYLLINKSRESVKAIDSLAVLPLENMSGDPDQEYFSDGMTEALITELSRIKALKVISRTSVMRFKKSQKPLPEIARQLGVAAVVEGSVLKAGDKVRITAQLIDAASDKHLWAESYERDMKEVLGLQKEVAETIAGQIKTTLTVSEKIRLNETTNPQLSRWFRPPAGACQKLT